MKKFFFYSFILILHSCTVNYSFTGADVPANAKTLSIGYFNVSGTASNANPSAGDLFTEELINTMLQQTKLDIVAKDGDLQYTGQIVGYTFDPVNVQADTEAADRNRLRMTVEVEYVNTLEPEKNFKKKFSHFADYDANTNVGDVEEDLLQIINETIAQDIFNASLGAW